MLDVYDHIMAGNKRGLPTSAMSEYLFELDITHDPIMQGNGQTTDFTDFIREYNNSPIQKPINARKHYVQEQFKVITDRVCAIKSKKWIDKDDKDALQWYKVLLSRLISTYIDEDIKSERFKIRKEIEGVMCKNKEGS